MQDVKQHKAFSTFFELDDMNDGEQNKTTQRNSKYVEFNPDDFIDIINQPDDNMNVNDNNDNNNTPIGLNLLSKSTPSTNPISYDKQISYNMISPNSIIILSNYKPKGPIITKLRNKKIFTKQLF